MNEQQDVAVVLKVVSKPLPPILTLSELCDKPLAQPPILIEGVLHQTSKMILGGPSKTNKSWCLLDLALSVASGQPWWGRQTAQCNVLYINFELHDWAAASRINAICQARPEIKHIAKSFHIWNLRGYASDITLLRPKLEEQLDLMSFGLIILDPAYKLLGSRNENDNSEITNLLNEFEELAQSTNASVVLAHHFAKGDFSSKQAADRMSGAGAWIRDPDSILTLSPHEEEGSFVVTPILRNIPPIDDFVVTWDYPLMKLSTLNPESIRRPQAKQKVCKDSEFLQQAVGSEGKAFSAIIKDAESKLGMSKRTASRYLSRLQQSSLLTTSSGLYWAK